MTIKGAERLPAYAIAAEVNSRLAQHTALVVTAPPGAGKSTLLPLTILQSLNDGGKVIVLEPRRLAARQIAERMASMIGEPVGKTVGYRVRRESRVSADTRIEVITEGILTRMIVDDATLDGVSVVVFDEFHERNINSDVALALTRETQGIIRPDLRIVVMSATIDTELLCQSLSAPLVQSDGRIHPVDIVYVSDETVSPTDDPRDIAAAMVRTIVRAHREHQGDILAFLPGEADIRRCEELLGQSLGNTSVCPLYGMLSPQEQRRAIAPSAEGERKVVLATSIAETSITIESVRVVVDSGLCRTMVFDQRSGLSHLETVRISLDMATQRCGRAGRVAEGVCYRLWNKAIEHRMDDCRTPEILTADLSPMLLDVAAWGESSVSGLNWLTPPPNAHIVQAAELLRLLHAVDEHGNITKHGRTLWRHPFHPRIAHMLVRADELGMKPLAQRIADILDSPPHSWPHHIDDNGAGRLLAYAYPERIAMQLSDGIGRFRLASGDDATVDSDDELAMHQWIAIASMNASGAGRIHLAAPLTDSDISEHIEERDNISWDNKQGCIIARRERRIGRLIVSSRPISDGNRNEIVRTICEAVKKYGPSMLDVNDDVQHLQRRVATAALWHPELSLPDLSTDAVMQTAHDWLPMYLGQSTTTLQLKKINLASAMWAMLTYEQQKAVDRIAPTHVTLPSGRRARIEYRQGNDTPIMRVRLQDCFGMNDTPRVDNAARPILVELLSPGFKPVQLTQDLRSFWSDTYFEVRKELRRRYPKHAWPEDPLSP